jgi:type II secretory pathway pseudopilin PulG
MRRLRLNTRGDTIVEVLIAMAVASAVLGGAYVIVGRTQQNSQQAQEHSEALGIAQGQVEQLQVAAADSTNGPELYDALKPQHCFSTTGQLLAPSTPIALPSTDDTAYPAGCKGLGTNGFYRVVIVHKTAPTDFFQVYVNWPSATGNGDDQVNLSYRPYHP